MSKHTPGPWRRNGTLIEAPQMALCVASVYPPGLGNAPKNSEECEANKRLIEAAPELLEVLKKAKKLIDALMPGIKHIAVQDYRAVNETPLEIDRAIAKAEGRS